MIQRIFIDNFRCLQNFEIDLSNRKSVLVIGPNGAGKSTILSALRFFQHIGHGVTRVCDLLSVEDTDSSKRSMRFEMDIELQSRIYSYRLYLDRTDSANWCVKDEELFVDNVPKLDRTQLRIDGEYLALPLARSNDNKGLMTDFGILKSWLSRIVILAPMPAAISGFSNSETLRPQVDGKNFASWLRGVISKYGASEAIKRTLRDLLPDFADFYTKPEGNQQENLFIKFESSKISKSFPFGSLSDGEKCFFLCAVVIAANKVHEPCFCLWDEPDNYLSLSEVGHVIMALRRSFEMSGQLIITSHNPEAIRKFSDENTLCLNRKSHLDPPTARWLSDLQYHGDLIESLVRGDIDDGGQ